MTTRNWVLLAALLVTLLMLALDGAQPALAILGGLLLALVVIDIRTPGTLDRLLGRWR